MTGVDQAVVRAPAAPGASAYASIAAWTRAYGVVIALAVLVAAVAVAQPSFLSYGNLTNILSQWAPVAIMSIGMTYVILTGGIDLSVGAVFSLCAVTAAALGQSMAPIAAFTAAILVGTGAGILNGAIVTILRVNSFIATLGSSLMISGVTLVVTGNSAFLVSFEPFTILGSGRWAGIPFSGMIAVALMVVAGLVLAYTVYGQSVYAVGGNREASRLAGIRVDGVVFTTYLLSGALAGLAGSIMASQLSSAQPNLNPNLLFDVLTVVVVGGTLLSGGTGSMWRTAVGVALLATLQNGFNLLGIDPNFQNLIKGAIIILSLSSVDVSRLRGMFAR